MPDPIRLLDIREEPLDAAEVYDAVVAATAGGVVLFVGTVRSVDGGRDIDGLGYSAHPSAVSELRRVVEGVAVEHDVVAVAAVHRVGELGIGDIAVVVAVACGHRGEAFAACRALIDRLKATVPIWKHQHFSDGTDEWVGTP